MGHGLLLALLAVGLRRLWRVNPADSWPSERDRDADHPHGFDARWVPWVLRITVLSLALPILRNPHGLGFADWDFVLDKFEAPRRTILIWGHFVVRADAAGRPDLRIHARGLAAGIGLHVIGAGLLALAWMVRGRQEQSGFVP
ncbi:MAG: hypothetical protein WA746_03075 [Isosphaeraceae bacterium]